MLKPSNGYTQRMAALADQATRQGTGLVAQLFYDFLYPFSGFGRNIWSFINNTRNRLCGYPRHRCNFLDRGRIFFGTHNEMLSFPLSITGTITFY